MKRLNKEQKIELLKEVEKIYTEKRSSRRDDDGIRLPLKKSIGRAGDTTIMDISVVEDKEDTKVVLFTDYYRRIVKVEGINKYISMDELVNYVEDYD